MFEAGLTFIAPNAMVERLLTPVFCNWASLIFVVAVIFNSSVRHAVKPAIAFWSDATELGTVWPAEIG